MTEKKDYHTGLKKLWQNDEISWNSTSLTLNKGFIYGTTLDKHIFKIDLETGQVIWESEASTSYHGQEPLISEKGIVFNGGSDGLTAYDSKGNIIWSIKVGKKIGHSIIEYDSLIIASLTGKGLFAFSKRNGTKVWGNEPEYQMLSTSEPAINDSIIILGDFDYSNGSSGYTKAINANNGQIVWQVKEEFGMTGEAIFHQNNVIVCYDSAYKKGSITVFDMSNGSKVWETASNPDAHYKPLLLNNYLIVPSYERGLDCYDIDTGKLNWSLNNEELSPTTDLIEFKDNIYFGAQHRMLLGVDSMGNLSFESSFKYGIGNLFIYKDELHVANGLNSLFKVDNSQ